MKRVTVVSSSGMLITLHAEVARERGLQSGSHLRSEKEDMEVIAENCRYGIADCEIKLGKISFPSELEIKEERK